MSAWELCQPNNLTLYCKTLNQVDDTNAIISVGASFYTTQGASTIQQRSGVTVKYLVSNSMMYIFMRSSSGFWNLVANPAGTGWSNIRLANWNSGVPIGLSIPYRVNSDDNIFNQSLPIQYPSGTFITTRLKIDSGATGSWTFTISPTSPTTEFTNGTLMAIDNFCIVVPVVKL